MAAGWRKVSGAVVDRAGKPVADCHVYPEPQDAHAKVLEIAVFSNNDGMWSMQLQAGHDFALVAATTPGAEDGRTQVDAGSDDLTGLTLTVGDPEHRSC